MVSTRSKIKERQEKPSMAKNNHVTVLLAMQGEMTEMRQMNEEEMCMLRQENEETRKQLHKGRTLPPSTQHTRARNETISHKLRVKLHTVTKIVEGESQLNTSAKYLFPSWKLPPTSFLR